MINVSSTSQFDKIFRKSSTQEILVDYSTPSNPSIDNFGSLFNPGSNTSRGKPSLWKFAGNLDFTRFQREDNLDDDILHDDYFGDIPSSGVEYFKFRISSITINRQNLVTKAGNPIPEANLPDYNPASKITFTLGERWRFAMNRSLTSDFEQDLTAEPPLINNTVSRDIPSEWIFFPSGRSTMNWSVGVNIFHNNVPQITQKRTFLSQRFRSFSFTFEFEYKLAEPPSLSETREIEKLNVPNLYKLLSSFFKILPEKDRKVDRDGFQDGIINQRSKTSPGLPKKLEPEEVKAIVDQFITRFTADF